jgi:hypothetical protein
MSLQKASWSNVTLAGSTLSQIVNANALATLIAVLQQAVEFDMPRADLHPFTAEGSR